jgi:hypothetical protein
MRTLSLIVVAGAFILYGAGTGNTSQVLSAKCGEEIASHQVSLECQKEGEAWLGGLRKNLDDPKWVEETTKKAEREHWCVSPDGCEPKLTEQALRDYGLRRLREEQQ